MVTSLETKRAVGYARVSSAQQAGQRHSSLETQQARFKDYCQQRGLVPVATFTDVLSGRRDDRREYLRMVDFVTRGGAEVIVVQFLDRFGRNPREILRRYWDLEEHGVAVIATDEDIQEELLLLIKAGMAGAESRRTSERVRAYMGRAVEKGVHVGRPPYGYRRIQASEGARWEQDPLEAPIVREMFSLSVEQNLGYKAIADRLSEAGHRARGNRPFASFTIQKILSNEALKGTMVYGKRPKKGNPERELVTVEDFFPAILTQEEWQRLQQRLSIRRENARGQAHASDYLLSGIIRCGNCGGPMIGKVGSAYKGRRYRNYWCSKAVQSRAACPTYNGHSAPKLERAILEYLGEFSDPARVRELVAEGQQRNLKAAEAELGRVDRRINHLEREFLKHLDLLNRGILNEEEFTKANEAKRQEIEQLRSRKADLDEEVQRQQDQAAMVNRVPAMVRSFLKDFEALDIRRQKAHLQTILKAAHVHRDGRIELEFRS